MNKRQRKKWLKKHGQYVPYSDCWNLDHTLSEYIIPRLKMLRKHTIGYPGYGEADTFEKWLAILDKMIHAFELTLTEPEFLDDNYQMLPDWKERNERYRKEVDEGLQAFAKYYQNLWW